MADTPNLGLERLVEGQASGETTHNQAINKLDSLVMPSVKDRDLSDPPGAPAEGDRYLVKAAGINDWAGHDDELAIYYSGWYFVTPNEGWVLWVDDEDVMIIYDGGSWNAFVTTNATEGAAGIAELATTAEAQAQTDDTRITTPAKVKDIFEKRIISVRKATTESLKNSTTVQDDDELFFAIAANEIWHCKAILFIADATTGATAHFKFFWDTPAGAIIDGYYMLGDRASDDLIEMEVFDEGDVMTPAPLNTNDNHPFIMEFTVEAAGTPGDVQLQWAQEVLDADEFIHVKGKNDRFTSSLICTRLV